MCGCNKLCYVMNGGRPGVQPMLGDDSEEEDDDSEDDDEELSPLCI